MRIYDVDGWDMAGARARGTASISAMTVQPGNAPPGYKNAGTAASQNQPPPPPGPSGGDDDHDANLTADERAARKQRDAITASLNAPPTVAPTVQKTTLAPTVQAQGVYAGPAAQVDRTVQGTGTRQVVQAPTVGTQPNVTAQTITAPVMTPAAQAAAATVGDAKRAYSYGAPGTTNAQAAGVERVDPTAAAKVAQVAAAVAPTVQQTQIQTSPQDQLRAQQLNLTNLLTAGATGAGPTAADAELQLATDKARRQQMGLAVTRAHGGNAGLALKEAGENIAGIEGEAALNAAALKAKEEQDAQAKLTQALEGARSQDIGIATSQAGLTSQANLTQAQLASQAGLANLDVASKTALTQAQLEQEARQANANRSQQDVLAEAANKQAASLANAGAANEASRLSYSTETAAEEALQARQQQRDITNALNTQQVSLANTAAKNTQSLAGAASVLEAAKSNQAANLAANTTTANLKSTEGIAGADLAAKVAMDNAGRELAALQAQAQLDQTRGVHNADLEQQIAIKQAELTSATNQFNASAQNTANIAQGQITTGENKADVESQIATTGQGIQREIGLTNAGTDASKTVLAADQGQQQTDLADRNTNKGLAGEIIQGAAKAIPLLSDERTKKDMTKILADRPGGDDELLEALDRIDPYRFEYKDPSEPGARPGKQVGVMAQDLEKSEAGKTVVGEEGGHKVIETAPALGFALAALAAVRREVKAMRAQRGGRR